MTKIAIKRGLKAAIKRECLVCSNRLPKKRFRLGDKRRDNLAVCSERKILIVDRDFITCSDCTASKS